MLAWRPCWALPASRFRPGGYGCYSVPLQVVAPWRPARGSAAFFYGRAWLAPRAPPAPRLPSHLPCPAREGRGRGRTAQLRPHPLAAGPQTAAVPGCGLQPLPAARKAPAAVSLGQAPRLPPRLPSCSRLPPELPPRLPAAPGPGRLRPQRRTPRDCRHRPSAARARPPRTRSPRRRRSPSSRSPAADTPGSTPPRAPRPSTRALPSRPQRQRWVQACSAPPAARSRTGRQARSAATRTRCAGRWARCRCWRFPRRPWHQAN
mmetsp:Transcript_121351/g.377286  ORF Transcript_121351/g.377286 Transcript_121351/m.377286 type:complete len:262 (+) Transcript_121351:606-1391(+)